MEVNALNKLVLPIALDNDILLRLLQESDAKAFIDVIDRDRSFLRTKVPWVDARKTTEDATKYFNFIKERFKSNIGFCLGIFESENFAGEIKVHEINWHHRKAEVGYWLGKEYRGQGLATRATKVVVKQLFENLNLNRVFMTTALDNVPIARRCNPK